MALRISPEAVASIIFGILQLSIGVVALWQQRQLRQMHRESAASGRRQPLTFIADFRFESRRYTI
jgi:hypothetical protein